VSVPVIFPVLLAADIAWNMIGEITMAMTTPIANYPRWGIQLDEVASGSSFRHCLFAFLSVDQPFDQSTALLLDACHLLNTVARDT